MAYFLDLIGLRLPKILYAMDCHILVLNPLGSIIVILITLVLLRGIKDSIQINNILTISIITFIVLLSLAIYILIPEDPHNDPPTEVVGIMKAVSLCYFGFTSFEQSITVSEEAIDP